MRKVKLFFNTEANILENEINIFFSDGKRCMLDVRYRTDIIALCAGILSEKIQYSALITYEEL
jgi:hypothetical protein